MKILFLELILCPFLEWNWFKLQYKLNLFAITIFPLGRQGLKSKIFPRRLSCNENNTGNLFDPWADTIWPLTTSTEGSAFSFAY